MNHKGKLLFVILCGLLGSAISLWLLPPVVNEFGQRLARNMWKEAEGGIDARSVNNPIKKSVPNPVVEQPQREAEEKQGSTQSGENVVEGGESTDETMEKVQVDNADSTENSEGQEEQQTEVISQGNPSAASQAEARVKLSPPNPAEDSVAETKFSANPFAIGLFGFIVGMAVGGFLVRQGERVTDRWEKSPSGDKLTIMLGTLAGVIAGILVSMPFLIALQGRPEGALLTIGMVVGCSAAMIYLLRSLGPYLPWETSSVSKRTGLKILDTNVLIDGRVYDLIRTGFLDGDLYVPQFVLLELQHIADSADGLKRQRGRRGLDVLNRIRSEFEVEVGTRDRYAGSDKDEVDTRLMKLCKSLGADLVSNDFNLNRTASIQEIRVLNINELSLALRPNVLPGELMEVQVIKEGNQIGQGVGYLNDGTMVVVENGTELIGQGTMEVMVTQVIQTERGKMIFADASGDGFPLAEPPSRRRFPRGPK